MMAPDGHQIFKDKVSRLFPSDDSPPQDPGKHVRNFFFFIY